MKKEEDEEVEGQAESKAEEKYSRPSKNYIGKLEKAAGEPTLGENYFTSRDI
jgi:hypothetical protein